MQPFTRHTGVAAPLLMANIDTDAIIPSREMRRVSRKGLAEGLFANWRYTDARARRPNPGFVLNQAAYADASILLGGVNFGCGSSREYAVWALAEYGIRVVVAPSFGTIFQKNCIANGIVPAVVSELDVAALAQWVQTDPARNRLTVDLVGTKILAGIRSIAFAIAQAHRFRLIEGLDPIRHTLERAEAIDGFERQRLASHPWVRLREPA